MSATPGITCMSVLGAPGTGKSTALEARLHGVHRAIIVDPYNAMAAKERFTSIALLKKRLHDHRFADVQKYRLLITLEGYSESNPIDELAAAALEDGAILVVDEAHEHLSHAKLASAPDRGGAPNVIRLVRQGRHHKAALWVASQRPAGISRDLTANSERYMFRLDEHIDQQYIRGSCGPEVADRVRKLPDFRAIHWLRGKVTEIQVTQDHKIVPVVSAPLPPRR